MRDDHTLLHEFAVRGNETAFAELVERHLAMVHGVCLRRTGDRQLAEELAQNVFATLARKSATIKKNVTIGGWLHRASCLESLHALRAEKSRQRTVKRFRDLQEPDSGLAPEKDQDLAPLLDEAINQLPAADRDLLLMRFVSETTLRQIGVALGKTESAAQRHLQRALERLSAVLRKRGITTGAMALTAHLGTDLANAAPPTLLPSAVSQAAITQASTFSKAATYGTANTIKGAVVKYKTYIAATACLATTVGVALYLAQKDNRPQDDPKVGIIDPATQRNQAAKTQNAATSISARTSPRNHSSADLPTDLKSLASQYGESRVRLAHEATKDLADILEMFSQLKIMTGEGTGVTTLDPSSDVFDNLVENANLSEEKIHTLNRLMAVHDAKRLKEISAYTQAMRDHPARFMELTLSSDAAARGVMPIDDYAKIEDGMMGDLANLKRIRSDRLTGILLDPELMTELRKVFDDAQHQILNEMEAEMIDREPVAPKSPRFSPRFLDDRRESLTRKKKALEGVMQVVDAMDTQ